MREHGGFRNNVNEFLPLITNNQEHSSFKVMLMIMSKIITLSKFCNKPMIAYWIFLTAFVFLSYFFFLSLMGTALRFILMTHRMVLLFFDQRQHLSVPKLSFYALQLTYT